MSWSEVFTIAPWLLFVYLLLAISGGTSPHPLGAGAATGIVLFAAGAWMNTWAEYAACLEATLRKLRSPVHRNFRYSRRPNCLGDLLSFSGMCVISGAWVTGMIPALMLVGFAFVDISTLASHLRDHCGCAFDEYARHTRRLIPFIYGAASLVKLP